MYVTYKQYKDFGYQAVKEEDFARLEALAEQIVRKYTFNRIADTDISGTNQRGICEIIDICFSEKSFDGKRPITSFSNSKYSESYSESSFTDTEAKIQDIICLFFDAEQKWRGF